MPGINILKFQLQTGLDGEIYFLSDLLPPLEVGVVNNPECLLIPAAHGMADEIVGPDETMGSRGQIHVGAGCKDGVVSPPILMDIRQ